MRWRERSVTSWRSRRTELWLACGFALVAVYFFLPQGNAQSVVYDVIAVASSLAIAVGVALGKPEAPLPWLLFAAGNLCFAIADIIFNIEQPSGPSTADVFYLAGYPLLAAGLVILLFASGEQRRLAAIGDAAILTFAFMLVQWVFVLDRVAAESATETQRVVDLAYPVMDIVLLAGLAGFFVSAAWRTPSFLLLVASIVLLLIADEFYASGTYMSGNWIDAAWLASYLLWAAAALHPSMRELTHPTRRAYRRLRVSPMRIV